MKEVEKILHKCRVSSKYKGYFYIQEAIKIILDCNKNRDQTTYVTKDVYPVIAHKYTSTISSVEAAIRNTIYKCWKNNQPYVCEILGYETNKCPSNVEFLNAVALYVKYND